jgi:hypothetical protein
MCMLIPAIRRNMKMCKRCTKSTQVFPCIHCGFNPESPSNDYRKNYNKQELIHKKHN